MEFITQVIQANKVRAAAVVVGVYTGNTLSRAASALDRAAKGAIAEIVRSDFKAARGTTLVLRQLPGIESPRVVLVGLGKEEELTARRYADVVAKALAAVVGLDVADAAIALADIDVPATSLRQRSRLIAQAATNATYRYTTTFGKRDGNDAPALARITVIAARGTTADVQAGLDEGAAIGLGMRRARELGNLPGNYCTPTYLGEQALALGATYGFPVEVLEPADIEAIGMGSFLSVARGSAQPARFIVLKYQGVKAKRGKAPAPVVLVGKGVTFDAGGISLKPAATMDEMKYDMCGAASVLGTFEAVARLKLAINLVGLIPACENLPSGTANKPGDVVTSLSGQTIEILNTDAEGRLLLCDALTYAERFEPASVIDIATLTGACVVALGHVNSGLFSGDDALADQLLTASREAVDPTWRLPLDDEYQPQLKSPVADIANIGGPPAGSVTAACFLSRFTAKYRWAHLDIAGTAWQSGKDKQATGRPVPLLVQYLIGQQSA